MLLCLVNYIKHIFERNNILFLIWDSPSQPSLFLFITFHQYSIEFRSMISYLLIKGKVGNKAILMQHHLLGWTGGIHSGSLSPRTMGLGESSH